MIQNPSGCLKGSRLDFRYTKKILMFYQSTESIIRVCRLNDECLIGRCAACLTAWIILLETLRLFREPRWLSVRSDHQGLCI